MDCTISVSKFLSSNPNFNLVITDYSDIAGDNGEYFYRRVREMYPNIKMTFLLSQKS